MESRNRHNFQNFEPDVFTYLFENAINVHTQSLKTSQASTQQKLFCEKLTPILLNVSHLLSTPSKIKMYSLLIAEYMKIEPEDLSVNDRMNLAEIRLQQAKNYAAEARQKEDASLKTLVILNTIYENYRSALEEYYQIPNELAKAADRIDFENCINGLLGSLLDLANHRKTECSEYIAYELQTIYQLKQGSSTVTQTLGMLEQNDYLQNQYDLALKFGIFATKLAANQYFYLAVQFYDITLSFIDFYRGGSVLAMRDYRSAQVKAAYHYFLSTVNDFELTFHSHHLDFAVGNAAWHALSPENIWVLITAIHASINHDTIPGEHLNLLFWILRNVLAASQRYMEKEICKLKYINYSLTLFAPKTPIPVSTPKFADLPIESIIEIAKQFIHRLQNDPNVTVQHISQKLSLLKSTIENLLPTLRRLGLPACSEENKPRFQIS